MYLNLGVILRVIGATVGLIIVGLGIYKFVVASNINQQIASSLMALFGLQLAWFILWVTKK